MNPVLRQFRRTVSALLSLTLVGVTAIGCAQTGQAPSAGPLALDPNDSCRAEREDFGKSKTYFTDELVTDVATGAIVGAVGGLALGLITHSSVGLPMAVGAAGGALAGGASAYIHKKQQDAKDADELARSVNSDLVQEGGQIDHTTATFAALRECRFGQALLIKSEFRRHTMDRPTALAAITYQQDRFREEIALARQYDITMSKRDDEFQSAINDMTQHPPSTGAPSANSTALAREAANVSIPEKRESFDKAVNTADKNSTAAFNLDSNAKITAMPGHSAHA